MPWPAVPMLTAPWTSCGHDREVTGPLWVSVWGLVSFAVQGHHPLLMHTKPHHLAFPLGFSMFLPHFSSGTCCCGVAPTQDTVVAWGRMGMRQELHPKVG